MLPSVVIEPKKPADSCVIWLHGLGADGHDFAPIVPELGLPESLAIRFIFPHAPEIPVTINGGMVMPAWYDILEMQLERKIDTRQLQVSAEQVIALIEQQLAQGIPAERIIIAGFSQGGAVAYQAALSYPQRLGGLLALSTYFATADTLNHHPENQSLPILIMHGSEDDIVPESLGLKAQERLQNHGYTVEYARFAMPHAVCLEQIRQIGGWLAKCLKQG
ncbi:MAG: alpha/beta hydrolase [Nitrincola lacisaponensis]|uniref:alpha/beta hydrolase n=1 Tax=Nitrincola lacisaponensis TaxID=267850 RepID=UPI00391DA5E2